MTKLNRARLDKPIGDTYGLNRGMNISRRSDDESFPRLLDITEKIAHAAALACQRVDGAFWMKDVRRQGIAPWGNDPNYKVFRNVVNDYHADLSGASDSTAAIQAAINDGHCCGEKCNGSTLKNAIIYFPPGTYLANNWPTIKVASSFVGLGVLSTNEYFGGTGPDGKHAQYYVKTVQFYSQIRNLRIDITSKNPNAYVCAIHYQVAQATSLQKVELIPTTGTTQQGICVIA
ncbi:pectate lyase superfamily protein-domain-containing protein [Aspergillus cavernicola]|uniref:Pectate lyase superfamily protein-domain-containing protein n=1 Tax=Aspergillus cavernicola TaxID=176166 RepID=A0ABR4IU82_9EURO